MTSSNTIALLQERIRAAADSGEPLRINGSGSKQHCLPPVRGAPLDVSGYRGIVEYDPAELVITARAGTPITELEQELAARGQMLGFEPPRFGPGATLGGTVASGLSGPRRPFAGAVRDFVLGVRCLNGRGEDLSFGGRVMKNVAGYDIARLMTGARGSLGVLLEISCKVLPLPESETGLVANMDMATAISAMNRLAGLPLPFSAMAWLDGRLHLRLSGSSAAVNAAAGQLRLEQDTDTDALWQSLREQQLEFFHNLYPLWRLSLPSTAAIPDLPGEWLIDWGGALRWLKTPAPPVQVITAAREAGGYAVLFGIGDSAASPGILNPPMSTVLSDLHRRLKQSFDPAGILNPGIMPF